MGGGASKPEDSGDGSASSGRSLRREAGGWGTPWARSESETDSSAGGWARRGGRGRGGGRICGGGGLGDSGRGGDGRGGGRRGGSRRGGSRPDGSRRNGGEYGSDGPGDGRGSGLGGDGTGNGSEGVASCRGQGDDEHEVHDEDLYLDEDEVGDVDFVVPKHTARKRLKRGERIGARGDCGGGRHEGKERVVKGRGNRGRAATQHVPIWFTPVAPENARKRKRAEGPEDDSEDGEGSDDDSGEDSDVGDVMDWNSDTDAGDNEEEYDSEDDESDKTMKRKHMESRRNCTRLGRNRAITKRRIEVEDDGYNAELEEEYQPQPQKKKLSGSGRRTYSSLAPR